MVLEVKYLDSAFIHVRKWKGNSSESLPQNFEDELLNDDERVL